MPDGLKWRVSESDKVELVSISFLRPMVKRLTRLTLYVEDNNDDA